MGGIAGAASKCQTRAAAAGLSGTWDAWISSAVSSPATRFVKSTTHYARIDGPEIAQTWEDLTDGTLDAPIDHNEFGALVPQAMVWTGTAAHGTPLVENCQTWSTSSTLQEGYDGRNDATDFNWSARSLALSLHCAAAQRLYCFEQ
ncbi:DUF1554 domain-containing protein [Nannocystis pusilla]|uniref:DUF1554 domain-containing protein n=1 Tax=Nannocystis pusilla TaxID=889268 RepID=A0ABS7TJK5_9BACT|nr:DUF1554 domain-containing protein [Nannocystis pusilla]